MENAKIEIHEITLEIIIVLDLYRTQLHQILSLRKRQNVLQATINRKHWKSMNLRESLTCLNNEDHPACTLMPTTY